MNDLPRSTETVIYIIHLHGRIYRIKIGNITRVWGMQVNEPASVFIKTIKGILKGAGR